VLRFDEFRLDATGIRDLPDGSIRVVGQLTRAGIFTYFNPDGSQRREYRPAEEVFSPSALESFAGATVTVNHPRSATRLVSAKSWKAEAVGHMGDNVRQDGELAVGDLYIRDADTVAGVKAGKFRNISLGYQVAYDPTPGTTPTGERYDGVQRRIKGNHVALLPAGVAPRGGENCVLRLDAAGEEIDQSIDTRTDVDQVGLKSGQMTPEQIAALQAELAKARTDAAELPALRDALKTALAQPAALPQERIDALVAERAEVLALAAKHGVSPKSADGKSLSDLAIKRAVVAKVTPAVASRVDSFGAETVDALLAVAAAAPHPSLAAVVAVAAAPAVVATKTDDARADAIDVNAIPTIAELQAKAHAELRNAWKGN